MKSISRTKELDLHFKRDQTGLKLELKQKPRIHLQASPKTHLAHISKLVGPHKENAWFRSSRSLERFIQNGFVLSPKEVFTWSTCPFHVTPPKGFHMDHYRTPETCHSNSFQRLPTNPPKQAFTWCMGGFHAIYLCI